MKKSLILLFIITFLIVPLSQASFVISDGNGSSMKIAGDLIAGFEGLRESDTSSSGFEVFRNRLNFRGTIDKSIGYRLRVRLGSIKAKESLGYSTYKIVDRAYIDYTFDVLNNPFKIRVGKLSTDPGVIKQQSEMTPITFACKSVKIWEGATALSLQTSGKLPKKFKWAFTVQNDTESSSYRDANQDNKYDFELDLVNDSGFDQAGYKIGGDLKYRCGINCTYLQPADGLERPILSPFALCSVSNLMLAAGLEAELTEDAERYAVNTGAAYLINGFIRPGISFAAIENKNVSGWDQTIAANITLFAHKGRFRPIVEYVFSRSADGDSGDSHSVFFIMSLDI